MVLVLDSVLCIHEETTLAHMLISKNYPKLLTTSLLIGASKLSRADHTATRMTLDMQSLSKCRKNMHIHSDLYLRRMEIRQWDRQRVK